MVNIIVIATNVYLCLGIRFIKKFLYHYKGNKDVKFYVFTEDNPYMYLSKQESLYVSHIFQKHSSWIDATNSKYQNILSLKNIKSDYIFYFDADTNVFKDFDETWFIGELVGGEHFGNNTWMKDVKNFDRNPKSKAYVPLDTNLPQMYYYGAFFGGEQNKVINLCETLRSWQLEDKKIPYEPTVNDESYLNAYFHYNPPQTVVYTNNFMFSISDKGGIENTRNSTLDIKDIKHQMLLYKNKRYEINNGTLYAY